MYQVYQKPLTGTTVGVVFGTFAPLHQGHLDMIFRAKKECDGGVLVICCGNDTDDKGCAVGLPLTKRYRYMREFFKDDDLVSVHAIDEIGAVTYSFENWTPWLERFNDIWKEATDARCRVWYVGEQMYHDDLVKLGELCVLLDRTENPISATMIRNNPIKYWNKIAHPFRREFTHKILVIGTASEGKSTLVLDLAKYFGTSHAHEWPRDYIEEHCLADWEFDALSIGPNDHKLMESLSEGGPVHAKYRRMITVYLDITAPLYWWKEFDTYKVGTVANSCSTMHKIHAKEFTLEDFSHEHLTYYEEDGELCRDWLADLEETIDDLNFARREFLATGDKKYWWQMIQLLPTSYNQKRTVMLNYEVLANIYKWRRNHKLDEWHTFCDWIEELPYSELITGYKEAEE